MVTEILLLYFQIKDEDDRQKYLAHNNYSIIVESSSTVKYDASTFDVYFVDIIYYYFF